MPTKLLVPILRAWLYRVESGTVPVSAVAPVACGVAAVEPAGKATWSKTMPPEKEIKHRATTASVRVRPAERGREGRASEVVRGWIDGQPWLGWPGCQPACGCGLHPGTGGCCQFGAGGCGLHPGTGGGCGGQPCGAGGGCQPLGGGCGPAF